MISYKSNVSTTSLLSSTPSLWKARRSSELASLLEEVYTVLENKEKELELVVKICQSLLEDSLVLTSDYQKLIRQIASNPTISTDLVLSDFFQEDDDSMSLSKHCNITEIKIKLLKKRNMELTRQLTSVVLDRQYANALYPTQVQALEKEIAALQGSIEKSSCKLQDLGKPQKSNITLMPDKENNITSSFPHVCCMNLNLKMEQLKIEYDHVRQLKTQMEEKLNATLNDLRPSQEKRDLISHPEKNIYSTFEVHSTSADDMCAEPLLYQSSSSTSSEKSTNSLWSYEEDDGYSSCSYLLNDARPNNNDMRKRYLHSKTPLPPKDNLTHCWPQTLSSFDECGSTNKIHQLFQSEFPNAELYLESTLSNELKKEAIEDALSLVIKLEKEYDHQKFLKERRYLSCPDYVAKDLCDFISKEYCYTSNEKPFDENQIYMHLKNPQKPYLNQKDKLVPNLISFLSSPIVYIQDKIHSLHSFTWRWCRVLFYTFVTVCITIKKGPEN